MVDRQGNVSPAPEPPKSLKELAYPSPSASILLISPTNEVLLLHRVQTSSSFASAHVFPGGHIDKQDGALPPREEVKRHEDSEAYRMGAIRECFEECGILLAKDKENPEELLSLSDEEQEEGRHAVHAKRVPFQEWVSQHGGVPDTENLIPFTRWLTPANLAKRFSTQMYLYFLPISPTAASHDQSSSRPASPSVPPTIHTPTSDGGIEHTSATFAPPSTWLDRSLTSEIILFPPQFFLLHLLAPFLSPSSSPSPLKPDVPSTLRARRQELVDFVHSSDPPWTEKCISPAPLFKEGEQRLVMDLSSAGPELKGTGRTGELERCLRVGLKKGRLEPLEIVWRADFVDEGKKGSALGAAGGNL